MKNIVTGLFVASVIALVLFLCATCDPPYSCDEDCDYSIEVAASSSPSWPDKTLHISEAEWQKLPENERECYGTKENCDTQYQPEHWNRCMAGKKGLESYIWYLIEGVDNYELNEEGHQAENYYLTAFYTIFGDYCGGYRGGVSYTNCDFERAASLSDDVKKKLLDIMVREGYEDPARALAISLLLPSKEIAKIQREARRNNR